MCKSITIMASKVSLSTCIQVKYLSSYLHKWSTHTELLFDDGVVSDWDPTTLDLGEPTLVDQLAHTLQVRITKTSACFHHSQ